MNTKHFVSVHIVPIDTACRIGNSRIQLCVADTIFDFICF